MVKCFHKVKFSFLPGRTWKMFLMEKSKKNISDILTKEHGGSEPLKIMSLCYRPSWGLMYGKYIGNISVIMTMTMSLGTMRMLE